MSTPKSTQLLVLDLDETLVHACETPLQRTADFRAFEYYVYLRPFAREFVAHCLERFNVGVWTSAGDGYAHCVIQHLVAEPARLVFVYSAARCTRRFNHETRGTYAIKDIHKLKKFGFPKERILFVDDSPEKLERSYGNLIRIEPWEGDLNDRELPALARYLETLRSATNVRGIEKRGWRKVFAD